MNEIATKQQLSDTFKLFAVCFYEPEVKLFEEEKVCQNLADLLKHLCPEASESAGAMQHALERSDQEELQVAHAELFLGPFELKASPYGSTYLEKERTIMGDSTMEVLNHYRKAGLEVDIQEPPDHISIELEFLSYLYVLEVEAIQNGDIKKVAEIQQQQKQFLETYVIPWMPDLILNIRSGTKNPFYLCVADCLEKFFQQFSESKIISNSSNKASIKTDADRTIH
jgi:TorA maturation chaperone TorD